MARSGGRVEGLQPTWRESTLVAVLDHPVRVHYDRDEEGEHHIDEEANEPIKVEPAEDPNRDGVVHGNRVEGGKHVVPVDEAEQALAGGHERGKLEVVGSEDRPAGQDEARVDEGGAKEEAKHVGRCTFHGEDEDVVGLEEAEVPKKAAPGKKGADT